MKTGGRMPFQIIRNDITKVASNAIVNTANPKPVIGGGTDSAIYKAAGEKQLLAERKKIGDIAPGNAVSTPAFALNAKYIIHTVGPAWIDGSHGEREVLHSCYANSLTLAGELSCESIAFPLIATGTYGFPKAEALDIALKEIGKFLLTHEMNVILVVFDKKALELSEKLVGEIDKYIDENAIGLLREEEYKGHPSNQFRRRRIQTDKFFSESLDLLEDKYAAPDEMIFTEKICCAPSSPKSEPLSGGFMGVFGQTEKKSLDEVLQKEEDTFQQRLFRLINERGLDDVTVYKRANGNRKNFSKIRCNVDYHPKKITAIAYAVALKLDMPELLDLISRAGYTLSPTSKFDLIISYFVKSRNYDIFEINAALFEYEQPLLSS